MAHCLFRCNSDLRVHIDTTTWGLMFDIDPGANHLCTTNILGVAGVDETPEGCLEAGSELGKLVRGEDCIGLVVRLHRTLEPEGSGRCSIFEWQVDLFLHLNLTMTYRS